MVGILISYANFACQLRTATQFARDLPYSLDDRITLYFNLTPKKGMLGTYSITLVSIV